MIGAARVDRIGGVIVGSDVRAIGHIAFFIQSKVEEKIIFCAVRTGRHFAGASDELKLIRFSGPDAACSIVERGGKKNFASVIDARRIPAAMNIAEGAVGARRWIIRMSHELEIGWSAGEEGAVTVWAGIPGDAAEKRDIAVGRKNRVVEALGVPIDQPAGSGAPFARQELEIPGSADPEGRIVIRVDVRPGEHAAKGDLAQIVERGAIEVAKERVCSRRWR